ncbi:MAG: hypothetical protein NT157_02350 [Candidatus Micrarchaeota archaeon]|nr:hypothetical protein [Candidatus Micrarchaeota archaeon]
MAIGFLIKGSSRDIIIIGETLEQAELEMKRNRKALDKYLRNKETSTVEKKQQGKASITKQIMELKEEKFFDSPKRSEEIRQKLASNGYHYPSQSLTWSLQELVRKRKLGRIKEGKGWRYVKR